MFRAPLGPEDQPIGDGEYTGQRKPRPARSIEPLGPAMSGAPWEYRYSDREGAGMGTVRNQPRVGEPIVETNEQLPTRNVPVRGDPIDEYYDIPTDETGSYTEPMSQTAPPVLYDEFGQPYTQTPQGTFQASTGRNGGGGRDGRVVTAAGAGGPVDRVGGAGEQEEEEDPSGHWSCAGRRAALLGFCFGIRSIRRFTSSIAQTSSAAVRGLFHGGNVASQSVSEATVRAILTPAFMGAPG